MITKFFTLSLILFKLWLLKRNLWKVREYQINEWLWVNIGRYLTNISQKEKRWEWEFYEKGRISWNNSHLGQLINHQNVFWLTKSKKYFTIWSIHENLQVFTDVMVRIRYLLHEYRLDFVVGHSKIEKKNVFKVFFCFCFCLTVRILV